MKTRRIKNTRKIAKAETKEIYSYKDGFEYTLFEKLFSIFVMSSMIVACAFIYYFK